MKTLENVQIIVSIRVEKPVSYETRALSTVERKVAGNRDLKEILQEVKNLVNEAKADAVEALNTLIEKEEAEEEKKE